MKQRALQFLHRIRRAAFTRLASAAAPQAETPIEPAGHHEPPAIAALPPLQDRETQLVRVFHMIENAIARADRAAELQQAAALQIDAAAYALEDLINELPENLRPRRTAAAAAQHLPAAPAAQPAVAAAGLSRAA